jgi:hypothetical protein
MKSPLWKYSYQNMMTRCYNPNAEFYSIYGGRGITVCEQWKHNPKQFYADMGDRVSGLSLDRIDVNGNYEPSNCRWATASEQARNRNDSIYVLYKDKNVSVHEAAQLSGLSVRTIKDRIRAQGLSGDALFAVQMSDAERTKKAGIARRSKAEVICPTGEVMIVDNIPEFCKKHGLGNGNFSRVLRGLGSHCKGFTGRYLEAA